MRTAGPDGPSGPGSAYGERPAGTVRPWRAGPRRRATTATSPRSTGCAALAVAIVVAFHLGHLQGGFLGVDLFFVLSGFLITSLLVAGWRHDGRVRLGPFWARRARRLLPAMLIVVGAVAVYARWWANPLELQAHPRRRAGDARLRRQLAPARRRRRLLGHHPRAVAAAAHVEPGHRGAVLPGVAAGGRRPSPLVGRDGHRRPRPGAHRAPRRHAGAGDRVGRWRRSCCTARTTRRCGCTSAPTPGRRRCSWARRWRCSSPAGPGRSRRRTRRRSRGRSASSPLAGLAVAWVAGQRPRRVALRGRPRPVQPRPRPLAIAAVWAAPTGALARGCSRSARSASSGSSATACTSGTGRSSWCSTRCAPGSTGLPLDLLRVALSLGLAALSYHLVEMPIRRGALPGSTGVGGRARRPAPVRRRGGGRHGRPADTVHPRGRARREGPAPR